jgi:ribonuclease HI
MSEPTLPSRTHCKACGAALVTKQTKRTSEQLKKPYYYTAYLSCPSCGRLYHDDAFKVVNTTAELFPSSPIPLAPSEVTIWTDGACSNNGKENAKAAWAFVSGKYEASGLVEGKQTNNTAEGLAVYYALQWASAKGYKNIKIVSDSQITLHNLQKHPSLIKQNREIFLNIAELIEQAGLSVQYEKVQGHAGDINNERADKLANGLVGIK